ncbi:MAG: DUF1232 domain-containing protein [Bacilli bacterium]|nr:DUF1232 domain-containing protein [Bacilli bacterium]
MNEISEEQAKEELEKGYDAAEELLKQPEKVEILLQRIEKKLKKIPKVGDTLAMVPIMVSLIRSYIRKEYNKAPIGSIIAIVSALIYLATPVDLIPDFIVGLGIVDDAAILGMCYSLVSDDIKEYEEWRNEKRLS